MALRSVRRAVIALCVSVIAVSAVVASTEERAVLLGDFQGPLGVGHFDAVSGRGGLYFPDYIAGGVWKSDATPAGTVKLADVRATSLAIADGPLYFVAEETSQLWVSDGTTVGTIPVSDLRVSGYGLAAVDTRVFFSSDVGFHVSDGTSEGTAQLAERLGSGAVAVRDQVFFASGDQLWSTDGTPEGTALVQAGHSAYSIEPLLPVGSTLLFPLTYRRCSSPPPPGIICELVPDTTELWRSDGTPETTVQIAEMPIDGPYVVMNGMLFFQSGMLWRSDGTAAGTTLAAPIWPYTLVSDGRGRLFAWVRDISGFALWTSDGTAEGTVPLLQQTDSYRLRFEMAPVRGVMFFGDTDGTLWRSDGTTEGTRPVAIPVDPDTPYVAGVQAHQGALVFTTSEYPAGTGRWKLWALADCASGGDCDDGDPCTTDTCRDGICANRPLDGYPELLCRVKALQTSPDCVREVGLRPRKLRREALRLRQAVRHARGTKPRTRERHLLAHADRIAARITENVSGLGAAGLPPACVNVLDDAAWMPRRLLTRLAR